MRSRVLGLVQWRSDPGFARPQSHARKPKPHMSNIPSLDPERTPAKRWWVEKLARRLPLIDVLREDREVHGGLNHPGCQVIVLHRLANWAQQPTSPTALRRTVGPLARLGLALTKTMYGIELPAEVTLGRRVRIVHQNGIVIHPDVVIEDDVLIRQNVTIGLRGDNDEAEPHAVPVIRSGASFGAGAVAVGPIEIGENALVGANAVVTRDVPADGKAVAAPTRVEGPPDRRPVLRGIVGG